jgi:hypothetical protein
MLSFADLSSIARGRLKDAKALLARRRYDGAVYLCGYAVEIALKARIVRTLRWSDGFPEKGSEFTGLKSFQSHDLAVLLKLSGWETKIKSKHPVDWSRVAQWDPESRYRPPGKLSEVEAKDMIASSLQIVGALL